MTKRITTEEFIKRAIKIHGNKYNYSKVEYVNIQTKVILSCPIHGDFKVTPNHHLYMKAGCPHCGIEKRATSHEITKEDFLKKCIVKFGNKFDYSNINYTDYNTPVDIICPIHGSFKMKPSIHIRTKTGCQKCGTNLMKKAIAAMDNATFINKCIAVHGDKYDYSQTEYHSYKKMVKIGCKIHGIFEMLPQTHIKGYGCPVCLQQEKANEEARKYMVIEQRKQYRELIKQKKEISRKLLNKRNSIRKGPYSKSEFIEMAKIIHNNDYSYDKVDFINMNIPIWIHCLKHNYDFKQKPIKHLKGQGCPKCIGRHKTTTEFIEEAILIHGNRYNYDLVEYKDCNTKVRIKCKEHGEFWQSPSKHIGGKGCPKCETSYLELSVLAYLKNNSNIKIETQKQFKWLKTNRTMPLDIFLPDYNIAIECQGEQHFRDTTLYGANNAFEKQKRKDILKYNLCKEHGIRILYFTDKKYKLPTAYLDKIYTSYEELLETILHS